MLTQNTSTPPQHIADHRLGHLKMKNLILAVFAALSLTAAIAPVANAASTIAGDAAATRLQQTGSYSQ
jgi:hypothetical protein